MSCRNQANKYSHKSLHLYAVSIVLLDEVRIVTTCVSIVLTHIAMFVYLCSNYWITNTCCHVCVLVFELLDYKHMLPCLCTCVRIIGLQTHVAMFVYLCSNYWITNTCCHVCVLVFELLDYKHMLPCFSCAIG